MTPTLSRLRGCIALRAVGGAAITVGLLLGAAPTVSAEPSAEALEAIEGRYATFGGEASLLGPPLGGAVDVPGGAAREYQGGAIYYSEGTGARVMYGAILDRYRTLGGPGSELGFPTNDESDTGDGIGRFNDFTTAGGASLYWSPQWGATLVKGRVLDAWRESGSVAGPFGYPTADTAVVDGVSSSTFAGPGGTEIRWSQAGGLVTIPAELAATIPGPGASPPAAPPDPVSTTPPTTPPRAPEASGSAADTAGDALRTWWWIPAGLAAIAVLAGLTKLLRRRPAVPEPVTVSTRRAVDAEQPPTPPVAPPPPPRPAPPAAPPRANTPPPPPSPAAAPLRPATPPPTPVPPTPAPLTPAPLTNVPPTPLPPTTLHPAPQRPMPPTPPSAPRPVLPPPMPPKPIAPIPRPDDTEGPPRHLVADHQPRSLLGEPPKATIRTEPPAEDLSPVITYKSSPAADAAIEVTYQNNAVGDQQASADDKSDSVTD